MGSRRGRRKEKSGALQFCAQEKIKSIAQVSSVAEQEGRMEIRTSQVEPVLRELFRRSEISGLEVSSRTLEEAFLKIVESGKQESGRQEIPQEVTA